MNQWFITVSTAKNIDRNRNEIYHCWSSFMKYIEILILISMCTNYQFTGDYSDENHIRIKSYNICDICTMINFYNICQNANQFNLWHNWIWYKTVIILWDTESTLWLTYWHFIYTDRKHCDFNLIYQIFKSRLDT